MVVNTSNESMTLPKNMKLVHTTEASSTTLVLRKVTGVNFVNTMPIYEGKQKRKRQFAQYKHAMTDTKDKPKTDWQNQINVKKQHDKVWQQWEAMLLKYTNISK